MPSYYAVQQQAELVRKKCTPEWKAQYTQDPKCGWTYALYGPSGHIKLTPLDQTTFQIELFSVPHTYQPHDVVLRAQGANPRLALGQLVLLFYQHIDRLNQLFGVLESEVRFI